MPKDNNTPQIDDSLTVADNQRATIVKYGFVLRDNNGHFRLIDPQINKKLSNKAGRYDGGNLDVLLIAAVEARKIRDEKAGTQPQPEKTQDAPDAPQPAPEPVKAEDAPEDAEKAPQTEITGDVTLDDTGKREPGRSRKSREPKVRKDVRYVRAMKVLIGEPDISQADLSKQAKMSVPTAGHCIEAYKAVAAAFKAAGWLKPAANIRKPETK